MIRIGRRRFSEIHQLVLVIDAFFAIIKLKVTSIFDAVAVTKFITKNASKESQRSFITLILE